MEVTQTDHVKLLVSTICNLERMPKGFSTAHSALDKAEKTSTGKLFLDHGGFATWLAYFVVKNRVGSSNHYAGQAATYRSIRALEDESVEYSICS